MAETDIKSINKRAIHDTKAREDIEKLSSQYKDIVKQLEQGGTGGSVDLTDYAKKDEIPKSASDVGADATGTATTKVTEHNTSNVSHNDIRLLITNLTNKLNALADSDDTTLDQLSEIVAYIKNNKSLIDSITTSKLNVSDVIDNLTTNVSNKALSAKQGITLKKLIDTINEEIANLKGTVVDSIDEMTDTSKQYILKSTGTIWKYKKTTTEKEITTTDTIVGTTDNSYIDGNRLGSSGDSFSNDATGYHCTPLIDLTKTEYQGKTIELHLEGCQYSSSGNYAMWIQARAYGKDKNSLFARAYTSDIKSDTAYIMGNCNGISVIYNNDTSTTIKITVPPTYASAETPIGYLRFCGKGSVANSNIYITYKTIQTVTEDQWTDTGVGIGGTNVDIETLDKISKLNNEGADPTTVKLLSKPVLDFYNASAYSDSDYTKSHLNKITYPYRADIPIPYTVKWEHNENAMRTTVAVDTKPIGTLNAYTLTTFEATGMDSYPLYNLIPDKSYYYKVTHVLADGSLIDAKSGSFKTSNETIRFLYIDGTQNVRDLGGWTGLNGKKVKYGKIIRGAGFSDSSYHGLMLTGKGRLALSELNIQAELNLGSVENETSIAPNCSYKKIYYTNYAIAIENETFHGTFKTLLEYIVSCLNGTLTETGLSTVERNIYMHCQGGCDRTGTLSFLLLGLLGVSESDLAKEYELSSFSDIGLGRLRTTTKAVDVYDYVGMVQALKTYSGSTITDKFYSFAIECGISADTITEFRNLMLE